MPFYVLAPLKLSSLDVPLRCSPQMFLFSSQLACTLGQRNRCVPHTLGRPAILRRFTLHFGRSHCNLTLVRILVAAQVSRCSV